MTTYSDIRHQVETLSAEEQLRLLEELAAIVRQRVTVIAVSSGSIEQNPWQGMSALEAARSVLGAIGEGPTDLSTNQKYLEGFGES